MRQFLLSAQPIPETLEHNGERYSVVVSRRATRRLRLRVNAMRDEVLFSAPKRCSARRMREFWISRQGWVKEAISSLPPRQPLEFGASVPVFGEPVTIISGDQPQQPGTLLLLTTPKQCDAMARRILSSRLRAYAEPLAKDMAQRIGREIKEIVLRDPVSCWGTCNSDGRLMLSWRLIFAPKDVLDYIIAHEVCHLREMNHSPSFWQLVDTLHENTDECRLWLRENGTRLHRYGKAKR